MTEDWGDLIMERHREHERENNVFVDPRALVKAFYESSYFKNGVESNGERTEGLNAYLKRSERAQATEEKRRDYFKKSQQAKILLLEYARDKVKYEYDASYLANPENGLTSVVGPLQEYIDTALSSSKATTREDKEAVEVDRRYAHERLASALHQAGVVPSDTVGRAMAGIMLSAVVPEETIDVALRNEANFHRI